MRRYTLKAFPVFEEGGESFVGLPDNAKILEFRQGNSLLPATVVVALPTGVLLADDG